jgi:tetratricopeptide (TPR) repeat protein
MGIRFRKSIKLGPGVRLNVGKRGVSSVSFGGRGMRYTMGRGGRRTTSMGIPGSGISQVSTSKSGGARSSRQREPQPIAPWQLPRPGFLARGREKRFYEGLQAYMKGDMSGALSAFERASAEDERNISNDLFAGLASVNLDRSDEAMRYLEKVVASDVPLPDQLMQKFLPASLVGLSVRVPITEAGVANVGIDSVGAALVLAELYQRTGRREEAIGLVQQLADADPDDQALRLSLCDLLFEDGDYEAVVEAAAGVANDSTLALAILELKARALGKLGHWSGALDVLSDALRKKSGRDPELLKAVRHARAEAYEQLGQAKRARAEWEKLYADDPAFRDVAERVRS